MKKRILSLVLATCMVIPTVACTGNTEPTTSQVSGNVAVDEAPDMDATAAAVESGEIVDGKFVETRKITVPINPSRIMALADGRLVVNSLGNYADQPSVLSIIDPSTDQIQTINIPVSGFDIYNNAAYTYSYDWSTFQHSMIKVDLNTLTQTPILQDKIALFGSIYGIAINPVNGDIYICDAQNYQSNGDVYCFSSNGQQRFKQETTVGPNKVVFVR